ncbi:hypothetical protein F7725_007168 [Dissostichus mawsoni]|uniref:Ion transport domain-containing protein n=1 Tax=Dissostichus mawsoni TaxID=36200 RepID=A0A7J5XW18_DISMA|nr:hypothetical protein F7725_007168 [Dissostichus mawsoni]
MIKLELLHRLPPMMLSVTCYVDREIQGLDPSGSTDNRFGIDRLFEAVASRDVQKLDGLHQYLHQNRMKLSNSLCECRVFLLSPTAFTINGHGVEMEKSEMFGISLETDNRTMEEKARHRAAHKGGLGNEPPKAPMDTDYQEEMEIPKPKIRMNANFDNPELMIKLELLHRLPPMMLSVTCYVDREIQGLDPSGSTDNRFGIDRLFEAVASRDVQKLDGLHQYLHQNRMKLSNSLCQTALHIAIERRSLSYVELLLSKGADVHAKACGTFFQPHDGPNFYFGELPLSLAACTNQPDVVDFLMKSDYQRANAELTDSHGNTVLTALVVVADNSADNTEFVTKMYDRILKTNAELHPKSKLEDIENNNGLTPLKMAAKTGKIGIFSHILKREFQENKAKQLSRKFTEWVYGPVQSSLYDLASVDSYQENSVLDILVYGSDIPVSPSIISPVCQLLFCTQTCDSSQNRHEMLQMEPLSHLLDEKWKKFAGRMFFLNLLVYILYLINFTLVAYNKKFGPPPFHIEHTTLGYLYVSGQLVTALANCYFFVIGGLLFLFTAGLYLLGMEQYLSVMVVCLALSWVNILYFSRGDRHMGIYSIMIQKMILCDILRFLLVYIVFLFGFSAAVISLLIEPAKNTTEVETPGTGRLYIKVALEDCVKPSYSSIAFTILQLFKFTIGMGDMEFIQEHKSREVFYVLLIGYIILTYILLLNMLIALMNCTVEKTTKESTSIWKLQRAITILDMEKRLSSCLRKRFRCGVEKNLRTALGDDRRRCFRVEEVNWNKWNSNLGKINEDPGCWDRAQQLAAHPPPNRGRSWRGFFTEGSRQQAYQSSEMNLLNPPRSKDTPESFTLAARTSRHLHLKTAKKYYTGRRKRRSSFLACNGEPQGAHSLTWCSPQGPHHNAVMLGKTRGGGVAVHGHPGAGADEQVAIDGAGVGDLTLAHGGDPHALGPSLAELVDLMNDVAQIGLVALVQPGGHGEWNGSGVGVHDDFSVQASPAAVKIFEDAFDRGPLDDGKEAGLGLRGGVGAVALARRVQPVDCTPHVVPLGDLHAVGEDLDGVGNGADRILCVVSPGVRTEWVRGEDRDRIGREKKREKSTMRKTT